MRDVAWTVVAVLVLLLGGLPGGAVAVGQGDERELPMEVRVPRMDTASAQLAYARRLKHSMRGRHDPERSFWRRLAIEAYRAVPHYHPEERPSGAEACFRAGELLRAGGDGAAAVEEFRRAHRLGEGTDFRARALLEIGHQQRRWERPREALDAYLDLAADPGAAAVYRDDAWLWAGRVWKSTGRIEEARRAWRGVAKDGEDPLDRVLAFDYLALLYAEDEDLEAAAGVLNQCLRTLAEVALEETERGFRVRKALQRMRVIEVIQHEVRRRGAGATRGSAAEPSQEKPEVTPRKP